MNLATYFTHIAWRHTQPSVTLALPAARLPVYMRVMLLVTVSVVAMTAGWTIRFRQNVPLSNPFADYLEILPGQPQSAVIAMRFSCNPNNSAGQSEYCTRPPAGGPFSLIAVTLSNGVVRRVEFMVRAGALTVGDLALLWGRPDIHLYRQSVNLEWPAIGVTANGWAESRSFSYLIPVQRIAFVAPSHPDSLST